jgi:Xaa-Pro aminopeptidase
MLQPEHCKSRQRRLLDVMAAEDVDVVVVGLAHHVYYFTGYRPFWLHESAFMLRADGESTLVCGKDPDRRAAADTVRTYESNWLGTQRPDQAALAAAGLDDLRDSDVIGLDASPVGSQVAIRYAHAKEFDEHLWALRRRKDPDEIALMRKAITCTEAMYRRAREIIEPGVSELTVYNELHKVAVEVAGEPLAPAYLGNDYACAAPGGPPRAGHAAQAGELYILDLGPAYRGYFSDNARTFSVDRNPTDIQMNAWKTVTDVFPIIERIAKPGVRCRDLFDAIDAHYRDRTGNGFPHHLGHGVGLQPHEFPHLNPKWDETLMEGEVFTCEPGMYTPELRAGMRIENQYLVTANGVENLTPFPLGLTE